MKRRVVVALVLPLALGVGSCGEGPVAPESPSPDGLMPLAQKNVNGTGLVLESLTNVLLVGDIVIDQAIITDLVLGPAVGGIVGLEAEGILQLTGGVFGTDIITQDFRTEVGITSSGPGKCDVLTVDLGPVDVDALGLVDVEVPVATVDSRASGAVGSLLCNLGNLLSGVVGGVTRGVQGVLNAINRLK